MDYQSMDQVEYGDLAPKKRSPRSRKSCYPIKKERQHEKAIYRSALEGLSPEEFKRALEGKLETSAA